MKTHILAVAIAIVLATISASTGSQLSKSAEKPKQETAAAAAVKSSASAIAEVVDKKQGDQSADQLFNASDEYVQIKPEEVNVNPAGEQKESADSGATLALADVPAQPASQQQAPSGAAEHKSADDELNAHLAQDSITPLESAGRPYAAPAAVAPPPPVADPRVARPAYPDPPPRPHMRGPRGPMAPRPYGPPPARQHYGPPPRGPLKGKSMIPHPPRPQRYPHGPPPPPPPPPMQMHMQMQMSQNYNMGAGSPRYLPRGAAAGYAAFRDFVRAQANRYKQASYSMAPGTSGSPMEHQQAYNGAPMSPPPPPPPSYNHAPAAHAPRPPADSYGSQRPQGEQAPAAKTTTKVTVAQAYIPHLTPTAAPEAMGNNYGAASGAQVNPMLAKLYGAHAPQGLGRPEYSKDYGVVIHYPQATVYTEPMTVDQLHKLAGSSIGQILEHLQYNLASGQRDESQIIRPNQKHNLGHGLTIHAKEYMAPGKYGQHVATTAAVISASASQGGGKSGASYGSAGGEPSHEGYGSASGSVGGASYAPAAGPHNADLGAGYERVKQAAAASSSRYNMPPRPPVAPDYQHGHAPQQQPPPQPQAQYQQQQQQQQQQGKGYGEPLSHIASVIGSELESLYNQANSVLAKQIDPEIHAHVQAHLKSLTKLAVGPLKMSEHDHRSPLVLRPHAPRPHHPRGRGPRRPNHAGPRQPMHQRPMRAPQQQQQAPRGNEYQQQHSEQAMQKEMAQLLHDFQLGDDQYTPKSPGLSASNQGYPHKLTQKYQQQPQQQQHQQQQQQHQNSYTISSSLPYEHQDGLEIPQGPNDQIGEISDLIHALKGTLEAHKPNEGAYPAAQQQSHEQQGKPEDVRYLANALGQVPSYAIQVPVKQQASQYQQAHQSNYPHGQPSGEPAHKIEQQQQQQQQQPNYSGLAQSEQAAYQSHHEAQGYSSAGQSAYGASPASQSAYGAPATGAGQEYGSAPAVQSYGAAAQPPVQSYSHEMQVNHMVPVQPQPQSQSQPQPQPQPQPQQQQDPYASAQPVDSYGGQSASQDSTAGGYGAPAPVAAPASYQQQQQSAPVEQQQQQSAQPQPYATSEHSLVVNHLVPIQSPQSQSYGQPQSQSQSYGQQQSQSQSQSYGQPQSQSHSQPDSSYGATASQLAALTSPASQQPANQIGVAAPTDAHYASAQSLSQFVDSLPGDYQELLRQPAAHSQVLEGAASEHKDSVYQSPTSELSHKSEQATSSKLSAAQSSQSHHHQQQPTLSAKAAAYHQSSSSSSSSSSATKAAENSAQPSSQSAHASAAAAADKDKDKDKDNSQ